MAEFDYIIIGAGSAGCVLADRLTQQPGIRVLVLEAGGSDNRFWIKVPLGYAFTYKDPRLSVACETEADQGLDGRRNLWPRGRVVGGCSSINAMAYMRGLPVDFDDWEDAGAKGWNWSSVQQTYSAIESFSDEDSGEIRIGDLRKDMHPFSDCFLDAASELGWPVTEDLNAGKPGLGPYRSTVWNGRRWSAADAFLRPALARGQVQLETHAKVQKIEIEEGAARGVTYLQGKELRRATARCEVIVSAGAVHSPQILQLSGIGPGKMLQDMGIAVQNPLAEVGRGLQDHLAITYSFAARPSTLNSILGAPLGKLASGLRYLATRGGPLSVPVNQIGGYLASRAGGAPDTQIYCNPLVYSASDSGPTVGRDPGYIISAQPCRPTSRGEITLASPDAKDQPRIQANSLATEEDQKSAVRAGRLLQKFAKSATLTNAKRDAIGPDLLALDDAGLLQDFRARASTVFHPSCTCRMGSNAQTSVLDSRLRVHGTRGLRVVDASAFPNITSGNTNAPTMMLAARAASLILEDNR